MPRKLLLVENSFGLGGSTVALARLLRGLDPERYVAHVIVEHESQADHIRQFAGRDVPVIVLPRPRAATVASAGARSRGLRRLVHAPLSALRSLRRAHAYARSLEPHARRWEIDLVHLNNNVTVNMGGVLLARRLGVPCVVKEHGYDWHSWDVRRLARSVAHFMPDSTSVADDLLRLGVPKERVTVTWCPVPIDDYGDDAPRNAVRDELGIPHSARVVAMNGWFLHWKGQHVFVEAVLRILADEPDVHGVLVGDAPNGAGAAYRNEVASQARASRHGDRVHFVGHRDDIPRMLAATDVAVHASVVAEPFGMVIAEAMAARRPVIATRAGGPPEFVRDGETGLLVTPGSVDEMEAAMRRLLADPEFGRRLGEAARIDVAARFGLRTHADATQAIYDDALRG